MDRFLSKQQLFIELNNRPGLIPVSLDAKSRLIKWIDLESYHFYEGFFHKSLTTFRSLKEKTGSKIAIFSADFDVLADDRILTDSIYPSGFIFHPGRSGSTLLAKVLARSRKSLVLSEISLHNSVWLAFSENGQKDIELSEKEKRIFKNLILATARRRISSYEYCFVKFTSYNILFYDFIRQVFPDVPAIFLYRNPAEILASIENKSLDWLAIEDNRISKLLTGRTDENNFERNEIGSDVLINLFQAAVSAIENYQLKPFNYNWLNSEGIIFILESFKSNFSSAELNVMKQQFSYYSKAENKLETFSLRKSANQSTELKSKINGSSPELERLYQTLESLS